ncbi:MAG: OadG family transporter subunit [Bacteroidota bacterium]
MDQTLQAALELLIVGMTTVALVLGLVVLSGRLLISAVNRSVTTKSIDRSGPSRLSNPQDQLDPQIVAVLTATVEHVTQGQGSIKTIEST